MQQAPTTTESRTGFVELLVLAVSLALLAGAAVGGMNAVMRTPELQPSDMLIALGLAAVPFVVVVPFLTLVLGVILRIFGGTPDRHGWTALLALVTLMSVVTVQVLFVSKGSRGLLVMAVVLAMIPLGALACGLIIKCASFAQPAGAVMWALTGLQMLVIGFGGISLLRTWRVPTWLALLPVVLLMLGVAAAARRRRSTPRLTGSVLALSIAFSIGLFTLPGSLREAIVASTPAAAGPTGAKLPNVVLIVLDTTRRDRLGCYGHTGGLTPELDRIAAESVVYDDVYSPSPWTAPSHASMFTGLFPVSHGCTYEHHLWLDDPFTTLAEMLKALEYQTLALFSNTYPESCNVLQGFDAGVSLNTTYARLAFYPLALAIGAPRHWVDKGSSEAGVALAGWLSDTYRPESPFFVFVNLMEPHAGYLPPQAERTAHLPPGVGYVEVTRFAMDFHPIRHHIREKRDPYAQRLVSAMYDAEIRYQDGRLGELLALLRRQTDFDNTLLIITAGHGENLGDHGRWGHAMAINEDLLRVPLVIRFPRQFRAGTRVAGMCQTVDFVPTVFDVLNRECPVADLPGGTLVPERFTPRKHVFAQESPFYPLLQMVENMLGRDVGGLKYRSHLRVIRDRQFKYVWSSDGNHALYDLENDPGETFNLARAKPELAAEMDKQLSGWYDSQRPYVRKAPAPNVKELEPKVLDWMRRNGYLGS